MNKRHSRSWLSMLLIMCMIVTTVGFTGGEKASAAGKSFYHLIDQTISTVSAPINETMTIADAADLPQQTAHLLIYANDVDERDGEWDRVTWNGEYQGILSGQNEQDSTTVFPLDTSKIMQSNNLGIQVTNGLGSTT